MNPRVEALPKFQGLPIPFFVTYRIDGIPDFKVMNEENRKRCATEELCWVCGQRLSYWIVFIGGPLSCKHGLFSDGPMHEECAKDSIEICPFLLGKMDYAPDSSWKPEKFGRKIHIREITQTSAPERNGIYKTRSFTITVTPDRSAWFFKAGRSVSIEWFERRKHE